MTVQLDQQALLDSVRRAAMTAVVRGTESVRSEMISLILTTPKTGRIYARRSIVHRASAPGEPPASDTGRLVGSIRTRYAPEDLAGTVSVSASYAPHLEYGTQKMEPRPFARPALANRREAIERDIRASVARAIRRAGR